MHTVQILTMCSIVWRVHRNPLEGGRIIICNFVKLLFSSQIHKLIRKEDGSLEYDSSQTVESTTKSNIWRVVWNATGTVLATSAEDGTLSLWRKDFGGAWINVQNLPSGVQQKMMHFYQNP